MFDYLTDISKEFEWEPRTRRAQKLSPARSALAPGSMADWIKGNPTVVEYVLLERPTAWGRSLVPDAWR